MATSSHDLLLCDHNITSKQEFKRWALKNHPDKGGRTETYIDVQNAAKARFATQNKIVCAEKIVKHDPPLVPTSEKNPSKAECMRAVENWARIERHHRFDKPTFDPPRLLRELAVYSPKLVALLDNIRRIDEEDMKLHGTTYKHFIFSDVTKDGHGAKIVASALVAKGFSHCFTPSGTVTTPKSNASRNTFGLMSSTAVFSSPTTQKKTKEMLRMFNCRRTNVHGEKMRFMVLDRGFKEGVDLFDVKYAHIFEEQRTASDLVQTVGRGTRWCGQKGLEFVPNKGWALHVYTYLATKEDGTPFFNDYMKLTGIDLNLRQFTQSIEKELVYAAVDHDLTSAIHRKQSDASQEGGSSSLGCDQKAKCGLRSTKSMPFTLSTFARVHSALSLKYPANFSKKLSKNKRAYFCELMRTNPAFCKEVNRIHTTSAAKVASSSNQVAKVASSSNQVAKVAQVTDIVASDAIVLHDMRTDVRATTDMSFEEYRKHINRVFKEYAYPPVTMDNGCDAQDDAPLTRLPKLNMTQEFISRYFVPTASQKGMLLWHSVGTGKTCTALALKSWMFEKKGYWVLWVTRNTLRGDVWKNIVDVVCDHAVRDMIATDPQISEAAIKRKMNKRFLPPMSYKQFSNMLEGKNENYTTLRNANGENILENTLVIIDEAHKLYGNDLRASDRADTKVVEHALRSARTSKVLLMTGTPIEENPMDLVKLLNLVNHAQLPTEYAEFHRQFLKGNEFTPDGAKRFREHVKRSVSYLNRRSDARQFAQPAFHKIYAPLSVNPQPLETCREEAAARAESCGPSSTKATDALRANDELLARAQIELQQALIISSHLGRGRDFSASRQEQRERQTTLRARVKELKKTRTVLKKTVRDDEAERARCASRLKKDLSLCAKKSKTSAYQTDVLSKCK